jgi:predicted ATP-grasp superfamily ATP-dependent carboligase
LLGELARDAGLDAPASVDLSQGFVGDELPFPAIVKPQRSVTDHGHSLRWAWSARVANLDQLRNLVNAPDTPHRLLQAYVRGTLAAVCGVAWQGELVCAVHQVSRRIWPPEQGISSYATTVPADLKRQAGVAAMLRAISWSGIFGVQFLINERGAYVIDFNPRIYGSMALAIAAGLNLPTIWADLLLGRPVAPRGYRPGVRYRADEGDYRALLHKLRRGDRSEALPGLLPRRRTVHAVFALSDPKPLLTSFEKLCSRV